MADDDLEPFRQAVASRFAIRKELGRGGTSVVYLADDVALARPVAVKVLRPDVAAAIVVKRFQREIGLASQLHHPNILRVLDVGEAAGCPFFVMPAADGGSLHDRVARRGALPFDELLSITRAVADALDYAHLRSIIHRDIKPANILFHEGKPVVADFGIARGFGDAGPGGSVSSVSGMAVGTPPYMSPEQVAGDRPLDGRTDVYSLGCVVFEMITGDVPFGGASVSAVFAKHKHADLPDARVLRPTTPREVQEVIERALAKERVDRYETAGQFVDALDRAYSGAVARRRRMWRTVVAAAALVVLVVAGVYAGTRSRGAAVPTPGAARPPQNVAVLYFDDLSSDKSLGYLAAGLTEDLIDRLSQVRALRVISPSGVRAFRDASAPTDTIAARLNVGTLVSGSIATSGRLLRLRARLIDATTGVQLNTMTIERPAWDLFLLQDSVSSEVERWLREHIGRQVRLLELRRGTRSVEAWEALRRGDEIVRQSMAPAIPTERAIVLRARADSAFDDASRRDPKWSEPLTRRAMNAYARGLLAPATMRVQFTAAAQLANDALSIDPRSADALAIRGEAQLRLAWFGLVARGDSVLAEAERDLRAAVSARPDRARAWAVLGDAQSYQGLNAEAATSYETALSTDAFLTDVERVVSGLFFAALQLERFDDARGRCSSAQARFPASTHFTECALILLGWTGRAAPDVERAWSMTRAIDAHPAPELQGNRAFRRMLVAAIAARAGMRDSALAIVGRTRREIGVSSAAKHVEALVRMLCGDHEAAVALIRELIREAPILRASIARNPWFRPLHADPGFRAAVARSPQ